jgi:hypothetical protein
MVPHFMRRNKLVNLAFKVLSEIGPELPGFFTSPTGAIDESEHCQRRRIAAKSRSKFSLA